MKCSLKNWPITALALAVSKLRLKMKTPTPPAATFALASGRFQLRVLGEFKTPEEIYGLGTYHPVKPVYLKDVARVVDGFKEETSISRLDGQEAVNITVKKRTGENIISISKAVDDIIAKDKKSWPGGTEITKVLDKAKERQNGTQPRRWQYQLI